MPRKKDHRQDDLFAWVDTLGTAEQPMSRHEAKFWDHHAKNPQVYRLFDDFAYQATRRLQHYSADSVMHRIRWFTDVETTGEPFKINNNYSAYYARLWMRNNPHHAGFFELRETRRKTSKALEQPSPKPKRGNRPNGHNREG